MNRTRRHARIASFILGLSAVGLAGPHGAQAQEAASAPEARAQGEAQTQMLDAITVVSSKTQERVSDALAPVSVIDSGTIETLQPSRLGDLLYGVPGVWLQDRGDEPSTAINIRGLQDFGRVAVTVDGARQNYQRTGHFANGSFFLNPELVSGIDIVRGPTANIYGSGAIGGVASFRTKDVNDVVRPGESWGVDAHTVFGSNSARALTSVFGGVRVNPNVDFFAGGTYSTQDNYKDGSDFTVANTWNKASSGIAKLTVRPADGHEIKLGGIFQQDVYSVGQPRRRAGDPNSTNPNGTNNLGGTSIYGTRVNNYMTTLGWTYSRPDDKLFDWSAKVYWNRTENDQVKVAHSSASMLGHCAGVAPGNNVTGCVGESRGYKIDTYGFDVYNTSRFEAGDFRHALTYGADGFQDHVSSSDPGGTADLTTPSGERTVSGAFLQWKANYTSLLEVIAAARYDHYRLSSSVGGTSGSRLSPKITVGLMPAAVVTPYVSYAEGYRAPSVTETLVTGAHSAASPGDRFFLCPAGTPAFMNPAASTFCFVPNPNLRPEVGKTKEIGINIKKNDLFTAGDSFRGKFNLFRDDVTDYIDQVAYGPTLDLRPFGFGIYSAFLQYQNIAAARIEGFEAETMYDANTWFVGLAATLQSGKNRQTNIGLYSVQPQKFTTTFGLRFLDGKVVLTAMWTAVKGNTDIPANYLPATSYNLVNLYLSAKPSPNVTVSFSVENLLNQYYRPYALPAGSTGESQNDVKWASAGAGLTFKGGLKIHFGPT